MNNGPVRSPLRQLAHDYATGRLNRIAYVQARRALLDAIDTADTGRPVAAPPPALRATTGASAPAMGSVPPSAQGAPALLRRWGPLLGGALVLLALAVGGMLWLGGGDPPPVASAPSVPARSAPTPAPTPAPVGQSILPAALAPAPAQPVAVKLLNELLEDGRFWEPAVRADFLAAWRAQSDPDQEQARASPVFGRLADELAVLIDAERADGEAAMVQALRAFQRDLGIAAVEPEPAPAPPAVATPAGPSAPPADGGDAAPPIAPDATSPPATPVATPAPAAAGARGRPR